MRILFATRAWESPEIEGGYLLLKDIARQIALDDSADAEVCFFSLTAGRDDGVTLLPVLGATGWGSRQRLEFFLGLLRYLGDVDVVHFAHTPTALNALLIRFLRRLFPSVTFVQTITGHSQPGRVPGIRYWGDAITSISPRVSGHLEGAHGIVAETILPYPRPDRLERSAPLPDHLAASFGSAPVVVFPIDVFRLNLRQFDVAALCGRLFQRDPEIRLVFLDRFGQEETLRKLLTEMPGNRVFFLPVINFMAKLLQHASVVVLPMSDVDGKFNPPMVLLEALYFRRAIVCSNRIDLPSEGHITRVDGMESEHWAEAIGAALDSGRDHDLTPSRKSFDNNCRRYLDLYRTASGDAAR